MDAQVLSVGEIKPALISINDGCKYLGGISRAKFYSDILPQVESVLLDKRRFITVSSLDRLIQKNTSEAAA